MVTAADSYISIATLSTSASAPVAISIAELESQSIFYYESIYTYLALCSPFMQTPASQNEQLAALSAQQFLGFAMDMVDECTRRTVNNTNVPFLLIRPDLPQTRNQARQKLGTMSLAVFQNFAASILLELGRRFPKAVQNCKAVHPSIEPSRQSPQLSMKFYQSPTLSHDTPPYNINTQNRTYGSWERPGAGNSNRSHESWRKSDTNSFDLLTSRHSVILSNPDSARRGQSPAALGFDWQSQNPTPVVSPTSSMGSYPESPILARRTATVNTPYRQTSSNYRQQLPSPVSLSAVPSPTSDMELDAYLNNISAHLKSEFLDDSSTFSARPRRSTNYSTSRSSSQRPAYHRALHSDEAPRKTSVQEYGAPSNNMSPMKSPALSIDVPSKSARRKDSIQSGSTVTAVRPEILLVSMQTHIAELMVSVRTSAISSWFAPLRSILIICRDITAEAEHYLTMPLAVDTLKRLENTTTNVGTCSKMLMKIAKQFTNTPLTTCSQELFESTTNNLAIAFRALVSALRMTMNGLNHLSGQSESNASGRAISPLIATFDSMAISLPASNTNVLSTSAPTRSSPFLSYAHKNIKAYPHKSSLSNSSNTYEDSESGSVRSTSGSKNTYTSVSAVPPKPSLVHTNRHQIKSARLSVEDVTDRVARAIQDLLNTIRENDADSNTIYSLILVVIGHTNTLVLQTEHIGRIVVVLAEAMGLLRQALVGLCMSLRGLGEKIQFAPYNRDLRQQIANTAYDVAKHAKLLLQELQ
ncbi:component of the polarisome [Batrachochytrium dendrobatidis]|nr:component of the polarisome [Batrachochytrium dendrobatidis]